MNDASIRLAIGKQLGASLVMLEECLEKCPEQSWDERVAKYPFWQVAYHTLCFVDCYLATSETAFKKLLEDRIEARLRGEDGPDFHPTGFAELENEYPSRRFSEAELLAYLKYCRTLLQQVLFDGNDSPLDGPSGFSWLPINRLEVHAYNARHVQHHAGQLSAVLRRAGVDTAWAKTSESG